MISRNCIFVTGILAMISHPMNGVAQVPSLLRISELRCEHQVEPINIETTAPRFSWILESDEKGAASTAYEVVAASRADLLLPQQADMWKSGRVESPESHLVAYAGKPLKSNQKVFWKVRAWDNKGAPTDWSRPSQFTTSIMDPADWQAQWIGNEEPATSIDLPMNSAGWIWSAENYTPGDGLPAVPAGEIRRLQREFDLPAGAEVTSAVLVVAADNESKAFVNGTHVGDTVEWEQAAQIDVKKQLKVGGTNRVTLLVKNGGQHPNPAAALALISILFKDGKSQHIPSDDKWMVSDPVAAAEWDKPGQASSPESGAKWKAAGVLRKWGQAPWAASGFVKRMTPRPIFRKEFQAAKPLRRATVHVCGLGHHKLFVNDKSASENFLDPAWAEYPKTCFYSTYDITPLLRTGSNAFGVMIANGFYSTIGDRRVNGNRADRPVTLLVQAHLEYADGTSQIVKTDETWKWRPGPYTHTSILGGVDYDARELPAGWSEPGLNENGWAAAKIMKPDHGELTAAIAPPLRLFDEFKPRSITEPEKGHFVYDFAQNASASPRIKVKGAAGAKLRLTYAEQRHNATPAHNNGTGRVDQSGIRSPNYLEYTLRGDPNGEEWFADLYYSGYQYIELTGAVPAGRENSKNLPVVSEVTSVHIRSGAETIGTFACSDPMYKRIDEMVDWSVRSNFTHVLTDCPHREKMGWLEVIHLMWPSIASRYDLALFGAKVARDIRDSQGPDGIIYTVAPAYPKFDGGFQYTPEWGASGVLIPWYTYQWYGDARVLEENYDCMRSFVDYMHKTSKDLVPAAGLGDWYDYGHGQDLGPSRFTPTDLTAMATFADCARVVSRAAKVLGRSEDERKYAQLTDKIAESFNRHFQAKPGEYKNHGSPQTANSIALVTRLTPEDQTTATVERIVSDMKGRGWLQTAGDVGFHYLVRALADAGRSDAIFNMLARKELGSYQYLVNAGWTALPESWNAFRHYSFNHCMLGHIQEWFSQDLVGIKPDRENIGFRRFHLAPVVDGPITSASGTLKTPYGKIECSWDRKGEEVSVNAVVPVNTSATLHLPAQEKIELSSGRQAVKVKVAKK